MYEFLDNNSSMEAYPVSYVNNPSIIGRNDNMVSINSFLQVDFTGQANFRDELYEKAKKDGYI